MESKIMIRNLIIIGLLAIIVLDLSVDDTFSYLQMGLDFLRQLVYDTKGSVNNI
tara:strand:- start:252 stop:413 length:162 start_codon:yes stop_codon:yes gene_type:complete